MMWETDRIVQPRYARRLLSSAIVYLLAHTTGTPRISTWQVHSGPRAVSTYRVGLEGERAQQERGRGVAVGGGELALLAEDVEVLEDKLNSLSL